MKHATGVALAALIAACSNDASVDSTALALQIDYEDDWGLTSLEVAIEGHDRSGTIAARHDVRVLVNDKLADVPIVLRIDGLRGAELWARARVTVTPVREAEVSVDVLLARLPCGDWCTQGTTRCFGNRLSVCEQRDSDTCMEWSTAVPCSPDAPNCSFGACGTSCVDECAEGEARCAGPSGLLVCGQSDEDSCLEWSSPVECGADSVCSLGACRAGCLNECTEGAVACADNGIVSCADRNNDGCTEWGPVEACAAERSCQDGVCVSRALCADGCAEATCVDNAFKQCGNFDLDACAELSWGIACAPTNTCLEGTCSESGCVNSPQICSTPPEPECVSGATLRVFVIPGVCALGTCGYTHEDRTCPNCPDCAPCADVRCEDPPSVCFQAIGTCAAGACSYDYNNSASCDDGNACTTGDSCSGGVCAGTERACADTPETVCVDANTLRTYVGTGSCVDGACSYPHTDTHCAYGCVLGACGDGWTAVSAGAFSTCGLRVDGTIACWGLGAAGDLAPPDGEFLAVSVGGSHACAIRNDHTLTCWGNNETGQLVAPTGTFTAIASGMGHSCALRTDKTVTCWGDDQFGQATAPSGTYRAVSAGGENSCAIDDARRTLRCWGSSSDGQTSPPAGEFTAVVSGWRHACAIDASGALRCWGSDEYNQIGPPIGSFDAVTAGAGHNCALRIDATVTCWGSNTVGQAEEASGEFLAVSAGGVHTCAIRTDGRMLCWGTNDDGQITPPE